MAKTNRYFNYSASLVPLCSAIGLFSMAATLSSMAEPAAPAAVKPSLLKDGRAWTDVKGRSMIAELVSATATHVTLKLESGKTANVELKLLTKLDQDFAADWLAKNPSKTPPVKSISPPGGAKKPAAVIAGEPAGFEAPWPEAVEVPDELGIITVKEDDATREYVYESTHFRYSVDAQLKTKLVNECAKVFEATHELLRLLPLNNKGTGKASTDGKKDGKFDVFLFERKDDYHKSGGPAGSAGVCMTRGNISKVLVPLESFGVRKSGKDYTVDSGNRDYRVLSHEITHQLMEHLVKEASWYIEGSAEYVAYTPYSRGRYKPGNNKASIVAAVTGYGKDNSGGRALGEKISMPRLQKFMTLDYNYFVSNANFNYGVACLLAYYWYHMDGEGDAARIKKYVGALQAETKEDEACKTCLLDGRTWEDLEKSFAKAMKKFGVDLNFQ